MTTKHGVLYRLPSNNIMLLILSTTNETTWFGETEAITVEWLFDLATEFNLTHLWVMPGVVGLGFGRYQMYRVDLWNVRFSYRGQGENASIKSIYGWKMPHGDAISVIFTEHTRWAGSADEPTWIQRASPAELLVTIGYLEDVLGVPMAGSPGTVGWSLLELKNAAHPEWIRDLPQVDLSDCHFGPGAARDLVWQEPLMAYRLEDGKYLHKFDKNAAYIASVANSDGFIGKGTPVHEFHGQGIDEKKVGVWRAMIDGQHRLTSVLYLPGEYWLSAPVIRVLRHLGYDVQIAEGYVFPEKHLVMQSWARHLWASRTLMRSETSLYPNAECRVFAEQACKQIAVATVGLTGFGGFDDEPSDKRRPDIKMQVVGRTFEVMIYNILKMEKETGYLPVMAYTDALYYPSDDPDGLSAFPGLAGRESLLGGFKWVGRVELTREVKCILTAKGATSKKLAELNKIGWSK